MNAADVDKIVSGAVLEALAEKKNVNTTFNITLCAAEAVIKKVFAAAKEMGLSVYAAVADGGANPVAVKRMDGAILASYDIALNKAYTSVALRKSTSELSALASPNGELYGIQQTNNVRIVIFGVGEPLYYLGKIAGAIGVTGGTLSEDTQLAEIGKKYWEDILCR